MVAVLRTCNSDIYKAAQILYFASSAYRNSQLASSDLRPLVRKKKNHGHLRDHVHQYFQELDQQHLSVERRCAIWREIIRIVEVRASYKASRRYSRCRRRFSPASSTRHHPQHRRRCSSRWSCMPIDAPAADFRIRAQSDRRRRYSTTERLNSLMLTIRDTTTLGRL